MDTRHTNAVTIVTHLCNRVIEDCVTDTRRLHVILVSIIPGLRNGEILVLAVPVSWSAIGAGGIHRYVTSEGKAPLTPRTSDSRRSTQFYVSPTWVLCR